MIFQLLLCTGLLVSIVYAFTQKAKSPLVSITTVISAFAGLYFVWVPNHANAIANAIGIGRGADLIFYCWIVISLAILLNLHFKVRGNLELVTAVARRVAIMETEQQQVPDSLAQPKDSSVQRES